MNLTESYLLNNGYDYFGNAAEDTLVFFVRDEDAPYVDQDYDDDEEISNDFDQLLKGVTSTKPAKDDNSNNDDISGWVPQIALIDARQTEVRESNLRN
ncbi:MAG: hypothetical protein M3R72_07475 [Bacteroidota bacterium]|nr:hypothetical protein [Bacteroidota bacterium]